MTNSPLQCCTTGSVHLKLRERAARQLKIRPRHIAPNQTPRPGSHLVQAVLCPQRQPRRIPQPHAAVVRAAGAQRAVLAVRAEGEGGDALRVPDQLPCTERSAVSTRFPHTRPDLGRSYK